MVVGVEIVREDKGVATKDSVLVRDGPDTSWAVAWLKLDSSVGLWLRSSFSIGYTSVIILDMK